MRLTAEAQRRWLPVWFVSWQSAGMASETSFGCHLQVLVLGKRVVEVETSLGPLSTEFFFGIPGILDLSSSLVKQSTTRLLGNV